MALFLFSLLFFFYSAFGELFLDIFQFQQPNNAGIYAPNTKIWVFAFFLLFTFFVPSSNCFTTIAFFPACLPASNITTLPALMLFLTK
jgi:hypothetical protein